MSTGKPNATQDEHVRAEIVYGPEECYRRSVELLQELGFPKGVFPLWDVVECGWVRETGFIWMKQKAPYEHFFEKLNTRVSYGKEITAYVEKFKMKKITGIKSKQMFMWIPTLEMSIDDPSSGKIVFRSSMGVGKSFPISDFIDHDEEVNEKKRFGCGIKCCSYEHQHKLYIGGGMPTGMPSAILWCTDSLLHQQKYCL